MADDIEGDRITWKQKFSGTGTEQWEMFDANEQARGFSNYRLRLSSCGRVWEGGGRWSGTLNKHAFHSSSVYELGESREEAMAALAAIYLLKE